MVTPEADGPTAGADIFTGTTGADSLSGLAGNDALDAGDGDDMLNGDVTGTRLNLFTGGADHDGGWVL